MEVTKWLKPGLMAQTPQRIWITAFKNRLRATMRACVRPDAAFRGFDLF
jgi:hypothetical protein